MRLLFISNLFPDTLDPGRGAEHVDLLHALADRWEIRVFAPRPVRLFSHGEWHPRASDVDLRPEFVAAPTLPVFGTLWNHRLYARALRKPLGLLRRDWHFDTVLTAGLYPDMCAVSQLIGEFHHRFVVVAQGAETDERLKNSVRRKMIAAHLAGASGVVTSSAALTTLLGSVRYRKDRIHPAATWEIAAEACHRLLLPVRG